MVSRVIMTDLAQSQLDSYIDYLLIEKSSPQAAKAIKDDALLTVEALLLSADTLAYCDDDDLTALGYRKIHFSKHRYLFLYRIVEDIAYIEAVYHQLQDYENIFKKTVA